MERIATAALMLQTGHLTIDAVRQLGAQIEHSREWRTVVVFQVESLR